MKLSYILLLFTLFNCIAQDKLQIETIVSKPVSVTSQDAVTGRKIHSTRLVTVTERLEKMIKISSKNENHLTIKLQGNINSSGHTINKVRKIRFKNSKAKNDTITLQYFVEIKHIPCKESGEIRGYNYRKEIDYKIPKDTKVIKVELYEDRLSSLASSKNMKLKLVAEQLINLY